MRCQAQIPHRKRHPHQRDDPMYSRGQLRNMRAGAQDEEGFEGRAGTEALVFVGVFRRRLFG
jgi:hypothetical protein